MAGGQLESLVQGLSQNPYTGAGRFMTTMPYRPVQFTPQTYAPQQTSPIMGLLGQMQARQQSLIPTPAIMDGGVGAGIGNGPGANGAIGIGEGGNAASNNGGDGMGGPAQGGISGGPGEGDGTSGSDGGGGGGGGK